MEQFVDRGTRLMERMLLQEALHMRMAETQRKLYRRYVRVAEEHTLTNRPHSTRTYVLVVDFGQDMELPCFNSKQPGPVYKFSPLVVHNLGAVNHGHRYPDGKVGKHMHMHVYHEGVGRKGSNDVSNLIMKALCIMNVE